MCYIHYMHDTLKLYMLTYHAMPCHAMPLPYRTLPYLTLHNIRHIYICTNIYIYTQIFNQRATIAENRWGPIPPLRGGHDHASCGPRAQDPGHWTVEASAANVDPMGGKSFK